MIKKENKEIEELIFGYFRDELSEKDSLQLSIWLKESEKNKKIFAKYAELWSVAHVDYFDKSMNHDLDKLRKQISQSESYSPKIVLSRSPKAVLYFKKMIVAASIALIAGVFSFYGGYSLGSRPMDTITFETTVPFGSIAKVVLPDNSVAWVNAGSSLKYDNDFGKNIRNVYLNGEAYFDVVSDTLCPFVVKSGELNVKVLGTTFNVKAYEKDESLEVVLQSGKVDILKNDLIGEKHLCYLLPNEMISYNKHSKILDKTHVNANAFCSWVNGEMHFTDTPFYLLVEELERKYNVNITIESSDLINEVYSGSFTAKHSITDILDEINIDGKYSWTKESNRYIIFDKYAKKTPK